MIDVQALARLLAQDALADWVSGERWWGQFDTEDPDEWERITQEWTPRYLEKARQYLRAAGALT